MITMSSLRRVGFATLAGAMLSFYGLPAHAQIDPQTELRIGQLEVQATQMQIQIAFLERQILRVETDLGKQIADQKFEIERLKNQDTIDDSTFTTLEARLAALESRQPGQPPAPGKSPDPARPADGQVLSLRAPFTVKDASGRVIFKVDSASRNLPRAIIGNPTGGRVEIGIAVGGGSVVGLYDGSNKSLSTLVGDPTGSYLRLQDNEQTTNIGKLGNDGVGLFMRKDNKLFGDFSVGKTGYGMLRVAGADGKSVGGFFANPDGGGLALTGPGGGNSAVSLRVTPSGGKIRVYPVGGGSARAELVAEGNLGALNVYSSDGTSAATVTSVASLGGKIELTNASGQVVVQAGHQPNGRGMVTTGPFEGGLAGTLGSGLTPASTIVGKMTGK